MKFFSKILKAIITASYLLLWRKYGQKNIYKCAAFSLDFNGYSVHFIAGLLVFHVIYCLSHDIKFIFKMLNLYLIFIFQNINMKINLKEKQMCNHCHNFKFELYDNPLLNITFCSKFYFHFFADIHFQYRKIEKNFLPKKNNNLNVVHNFCTI